MSKNIDRIAKSCVAAAREMLGAGWGHVSQEVRLDLARSRVLGIVLAQDETTDPVRVLAMAEGLAARVEEIINHPGDAANALR